LLLNPIYVYIYSDVAKGEEDQAGFDFVRAYIKLIHGFKTITIHESDSNKGLASSIIKVVNDILKFMALLLPWKMIWLVALIF
jgi:hypothetical protein